VLRALPWICIIAIIAVVQVVRDAPVDAAVFGLVAVALAIDAAGVVPSRFRLRPPLWLAIAVPVAAGVALVLAPRHGVLAGVVVGAIGIGAVALAWSDPPPVSRQPDRRRVVRASIAWAAVAIATCLWELTSFLVGRPTETTKLDHPALSDLIDPALDGMAGYVVFIVLWLAAGVALLRRGRAR
jgi:hypothetical protein